MNRLGGDSIECFSTVEVYHIVWFPTVQTPLTTVESKCRESVLSFYATFFFFSDSELEVIKIVMQILESLQNM